MTGTNAMDDADTTAGSSSGSTGENNSTGAQPGEACPQNYAPVCGKDGNTYDNACVAQAAGVEIRRNTPCVGDCNDACQLGHGDGIGTLTAALVLVLLRRRRSST